MLKFRRICVGLMTFASLSLWVPALTASANFIVPSNGNLYLQCTGGSAGATSQFGIGSSSTNFVPYLSNLPSSCPDSEVLVGPVTTGETIEFGMSTLWGGQTYWAFSGNADQASTVAFTDVCNNMGMNGSVTQQTGTDTWVMHLDDAAHYTISQCGANNIIIQIRLAPTSTTSSPPPPNASCSVAAVLGAYTFAFNGSYIDSSNKQNAFSAAGRLVADGKGSFSGTETVSQGGVITRGAQYTGTYTVNGDCTGSATFSTGSHLDFIITNNNQGLIDFIQTDQGTNIAGTAQQQVTSISRRRF